MKHILGCKNVRTIYTSPLIKEVLNELLDTHQHQLEYSLLLWSSRLYKFFNENEYLTQRQMNVFKGILENFTLRPETKIALEQNEQQFRRVA